jgi:23S rRNA (guanosine2251-2'-O)-methyltransferase
MMHPKRPSESRNELIFGVQPVLEALQSGKEFESIFILKTAGGAQLNELKKLLKDRSLAYQAVPVEKLNRLTTKNHQGVVGFVSPIQYSPLDVIVDQIYSNGEVPFLILLDRVTDVRNIGAIARTAHCAGAHAIIVPFRGSAQINADAIKASAGALFHLPVCRELNLKFTLQFLKDSGLQVIACSEKGSDAYYKVDYNVPTVVVMGSEEDGISPEYLKYADHMVQIPMAKEFSSLNVSVATGIISFEVLRQRGVFK